MGFTANDRHTIHPLRLQYCTASIEYWIRRVEFLSAPLAEDKRDVVHMAVTFEIGVLKILD